MTHSIIRWNFDKPSYRPGESASVSFWLYNARNHQVYLSNLEIVFDFGTYTLESIGGMVVPGSEKFLGTVPVELPKDVVGIKEFTLGYRIQALINGNWADQGHLVSGNYFISIYPTPLYKVFVSRGLRIEDRAIGDPIAYMIREWGFSTVTVGIELLVHERGVPDMVRAEIKRSDGLIAIATPRFLDALSGLWRTLEWCHNEAGIAFGLNKPLLLLKDNRISLGGLPSYLSELKNQPVMEFDPYNLSELKMRFSAIMPGFRNWIANKKRQEFFGTLAKIAVGGLAVKGLLSLMSGSTGSIHDLSR